MTDKLPQCLTLVSIYAVYFFTFLLAGAGKVKEGKVPDWFKGQFANTFLAKFPGLSVAYWTIAVLECSVPAILTLSLLQGELCGGNGSYFLQLAVSVASLIFFVLGFGQRLANDFPGAANSFFYFAGTLVTQLMISKLVP